MRKSFEGVEKYRVRTGKFASNTGDHWGAFIVMHPKFQLKIIVDDGCNPDVSESLRGWEHVSVSALVNEKGAPIEFIPTWSMMCLAKQLFWHEDECVIQYHPPGSVYVNNKENVLHLWKKVGQEFEMPPIELV